jgi:hypothetical protein
MSIIDLDIDRGDIDELIVKLYEDFKIWEVIYHILNSNLSQVFNIEQQH